ncbi:hypothetical protein [Burkholderia diffusa]|uniref:hypothetical protein n=1 Tax=Burkholderia diffusa TaxID=488732 RepID=UPI00158A6D98|nr:hypothetical protein [Burkholderia diffusa]
MSDSNQQRTPSRPVWLKKSLQGIAFWLGYRQSLYARRPLTESSIVTELSDLIHTNLRNNLELRGEVPFSKFLRGDLPATLGKQARVDLVVATKLPRVAGQRSKLRTEYIIEVKRGDATKKSIDADLKRLWEVKNARPTRRTLLFVISEGKRPTRFTLSNGEPKGGPFPIPERKGYFRVHDVYTATGSDGKSVHYACHIEVYVRKSA